VHVRVCTGRTICRRNYLTLGSGLSVAGVFFHPMLLLLIGVLYYAHRRAQSDDAIVVMGRELGCKCFAAPSDCLLRPLRGWTDTGCLAAASRAATEKNAGMIVLTITMVLITGALETILWIFGFAAMIIAAHAATHVPAVQTSGAEQLNNVV
jgi:hypothetical protein